MNKIEQKAVRKDGEITMCDLLNIEIEELTKQKEIEEMAKELTAYERKLCDRLPKNKCLLTSTIHAQLSCDYCKIAEFLINAGYRNVKDKVVLSREEFEKGKQDYNYQIHRALVAEGRVDKARQETARKIIDKVDDMIGGKLIAQALKEIYEVE